MKLVPIRKLVKKTKQINPHKLGRDSFVYIDISSIDKDVKAIINPQILPVDDAPSRARQEIRTDDVLVATVRPNLNGVAIVPRKYDNQIASTGFCILRADYALLYPHYLFYFTQTIHFVTDLTKFSIGAGYPAVTDEDILDMEIPLPSLHEQQRIAAILQKTDRLRRLRRYARHLSDTYLQSGFLEIFGDPVSNPKGWNKEKSEQIITDIRYGTGSPPAYIENGIPFIRATNVKNGTIQPDDMVFISEKDAKKISKCKLKEGDLILVRSGINSGDCALIPKHYHGAFAAYDLIIEIPYPYNYYYNFLINSDFGKQIIDTLSRRAGQPHINSDQVKSICIPYPDIGLIEKFTRIIQGVDKLRIKQFESSRQAENLFQSLLQRAFQGEL